MSNEISAEGWMASELRLDIEAAISKLLKSGSDQDSVSIESFSLAKIEILDSIKKLKLANTELCKLYDAYTLNLERNVRSKDLPRDGDMYPGIAH